MFYYEVKDFTDESFLQFKILTYVKNILLLIAWFISSTSGGVSLSDIELEQDADADLNNDQGSDGCEADHDSDE